ncbi:MAG: DNA polymerase III subunit alpha [Chitinophagales bacterium]
MALFVFRHITDLWVCHMYLNCNSHFSLNYGTLSVIDLLTYAKEAGVTTMALTDINNTSGCLDFMRLAKDYGINPVIGIDFRRNTEQLYVCLAKNAEGFKQLNEFLTIHRQNHTELPDEPPALPDCFVIYPWKKGFNRSLKENEFVGLRHYDVTAFRLFGKCAADKLVALAPVTFRNKKDFNTHRILRAIYHNELLSKLPKDEQGKEEDRLLTADEMKEAYAEFPETLTNAQQLLAQCHIDFQFKQAKNKRCFSSSVEEDNQLLTAKAEEGLHYRYKEITPEIRKRFDSELTTIIEQGFCAYFLINLDIVNYAKQQGFFYIGRGSGANSLIAYCLQITDVDPIELNLYFERFINSSRKNPPDFDIDFSHIDRDQIREHIFKKYGNCAALVGSYNTFERKSAIREVGKVFGLTDSDIEHLQEGRIDKTKADQYGKLVLEYADHLHEMPNMLSIHACGILISELPITYYTALELMPVGFASTQFSMLEAEDVGLYKFDILSQRGLGHIKDAVDLVKQNQGIEVDIHRIQDFKEDERIKQMLKTGDSIGCFYVESPAMRQLMRKLEVQDYLGLVAASSVIRPGVSSSGMMREYILRYRYPERRELAHPQLLKIMPETFGVMVYQEDVIKVAHLYAGLTLEEADVMRRGMSGKFRSRAEFQAVREKFFSNCAGKGYAFEEVAEIWRQIESFAGYSFAKGHSASYAVESYQSLYLRAYYPIEFMTGVLNNFGGFYSTEFYLHEAKMLGANVELPCINNSQNLAVLNGKTIYMGLCLIKDLEQKSLNHILLEREYGGQFKSLEDFIKRVPISLEQLRILIRIKAFRFTGKTNRELLWNVHMFLGKTKKTTPRKELFENPADNTEIPTLDYSPLVDAQDEMEILGFPYTSPFELLTKNYDKAVTPAQAMMKHLGKTIYMLGYYVNIKRVTTITGQIMYFGSFVDKAGKLFDTVHFPLSIEQYPFTGKGCYLLKGRVIEDFNVPSLEVVQMQRVPWAFADDKSVTF